jgi:hypothetical protein
MSAEEGKIFENLSGRRWVRWLEEGLIPRQFPLML